MDIYCEWIDEAERMNDPNYDKRENDDGFGLTSKPDLAKITSAQNYHEDSDEEADK